jgi:hypothetical protein
MNYTPDVGKMISDKIETYNLRGVTKAHDEIYSPAS